MKKSEKMKRRISNAAEQDRRDAAEARKDAGKAHKVAGKAAVEDREGSTSCGGRPGVCGSETSATGGSDESTCGRFQPLESAAQNHNRVDCYCSPINYRRAVPDDLPERIRPPPAGTAP